MMQCIVVADRARARLFSVEKEGVTPFEAGRRRLREHLDLVSPEGKLSDHELFRDTRAGRKNRLSVPRGGYGLDDGKAAEREESSRRFSREVVAATSTLVRALKPKRLLLVASPKFLGVLRAEMKKAIPKGVVFAAFAEDLSRHSPTQIEETLGRQGALDFRPLPEAARSRLRRR
jgi:protein required for attachment to host cells